ncbi:MAG: alpha/beta fold hydrolase [Anaerolineales bacterium]|jgi:pimeloyl-ACP methyl ester carboxylesterase
MVENYPSPAEGEIPHFSGGKETPAILVHGFGASHFDWVYLSPELEKRGYQVFAPDLVGHGSSNSKAPSSGYTFKMLYEQFAHSINSLQFDRKINLIGHSLGGLICLYFALKNPAEVNKLVLINPYYDKSQLNPFLKYISSNPAPYKKALEIAPPWLIHLGISLDIRGQFLYEDHTRKQKAEDISRADPEIVFIIDSIPNIENHLSQIQSPACIVWGTKDLTLNPDSFPSLVEALPHATGKPIQGAGHQPHLSDVEQVNQIIMDFISTGTRR